MDLELTGKSAIVTGGSRGVGRAIATSLLREGARVMLVARDAARLEATRAELARKSGGDVHCVSADLERDAERLELFFYRENKLISAVELMLEQTEAGGTRGQKNYSSCCLLYRHRMSIVKP